MRNSSRSKLCHLADKLGNKMPTGCTRCCWSMLLQKSYGMRKQQRLTTSQQNHGM